MSNTETKGKVFFVYFSLSYRVPYMLQFYNFFCLIEDRNWQPLWGKLWKFSVIFLCEGNCQWKFIRKVRNWDGEIADFWSFLSASIIFGTARHIFYFLYISISSTKSTNQQYLQKIQKSTTTPSKRNPTKAPQWKPVSQKIPAKKREL